MTSLPHLLQNAPVLLEGAMGTLLMGRNLPPGALGEILNLRDPDFIASVHHQYAAAGARIHFSNTFSGNPIRLGNSGLAEQCHALNAAGVRLARSAARAEALVAGSIGPTGELLAPFGTLTADAAEAAFATQAAALADGGVDVFWIETMMALAETEAAIAGCRRAGTQPIVATLTFTESPRGFHTMMGHSLADAVHRLEAAGVAALGANCQLDPPAMVRLAEQLRPLTALPIVIQPNAGQPVLRDGHAEYLTTADEFAASVQRLAALRVDLIGGCCGTTPGHIAAANLALTRKTPH